MSASRTRAAVTAPFASGTMTMLFSPVRESTRMWATPVAPSTSSTQPTSTWSARSASRATAPNGSRPTAPTIRVVAPERAAATAWLAPLPPSSVENRVPDTVSPGRGRGEAVTVRSTLMLPTTTTVPGPAAVRPAVADSPTMREL